MATETLTRPTSVAELDRPDLIAPTHDPVAHNSEPVAPLTSRRREKFLKSFWVSLKPVKSSDSTVQIDVQQQAVENGVTYERPSGNRNGNSAKRQPKIRPSQNQAGASPSDVVGDSEGKVILSRWKRLRQREKPPAVAAVATEASRSESQALATVAVNEDGDNAVPQIAVVQNATTAPAPDILTAENNAHGTAPHQSPQQTIPTAQVTEEIQPDEPIANPDQTAPTGNLQDVTNFPNCVLEPIGSPRLYQAEKGVFVGESDMIQPPELVIQEWTQAILPRLRINLRSALGSLPRSLPRAAKSGEPELCMSGRATQDGTHAALVPTIWIRCGSPECQGKLQDVAEYLRRTQQIPVHLTLRAPRPAGFKMSPMELHNGTDFLPRDTTDDIINIALGIDSWEQSIGSSTIRIRIQPNKSDPRSACGLEAHLSAPNGCTYICTIGGMVVIDDELYALTTAHALWDSGLYTDDTSDTSSGSEKHLIYDSSFLPVKTPAKDLSGSNISAKDAELKQYRSWMDAALCAASYTASNSPDNLPSELAGSTLGSAPCRDFALLHVDIGKYGPIRNKYRSPSGESMINSVSHDLKGRQVSLLCSHDKFRTGRLVEGPSCIIDDTGYWETRKIRLTGNTPLSQGASGTWVVDGSALLGIIVAVYEDEPFVHMLPIQDVFHGIESLLTKGSRKPSVKIMDYSWTPSKPLNVPPNVSKEKDKMKRKDTSLSAIEEGLANRHDKEKEIIPPYDSLDSYRRLNPLVRAASLFSVVILAIAMALDISAFPILLPEITDVQNSVDLVGWYGTVYFLMFGLTYSTWDSLAIVLTQSEQQPTDFHFLSILGGVCFIAGSIFSGARFTGGVLVGRALCGMGAAASYSILLCVQDQLLPLKRGLLEHPLNTVALSLSLGVPRFVGPLIGGSLLHMKGFVTPWSAFFIVTGSLAIAGTFLSFAIVLLSIRGRLQSIRKVPLVVTRLMSHAEASLAFIHVLWAGFGVCMLLALYYGPSRRWTSTLVLPLLFVGVGGFLLIGTFMGWHWPRTTANMPPLKSKHRLHQFGQLCCVALWGASYYSLSHFFPIWLRAVRGESSMRTAVMSLPLATTYLFMATLEHIARFINWYPKLGGLQNCDLKLATSLCYMAVGAGLLSRLGPNSSSSLLLGLESLFALAAGFRSHVAEPGFIHWAFPQMAILPRGPSRKDWDRNRMAYFARVISAEMIGGAIGIAAAQAVFMSFLRKSLKDNDALSIVLQTGATNFKEKLNGTNLDSSINIYNEAITRSFFVATAASALPWGVVAAMIGLLITPPGICLYWYFLRKKKSREYRKRPSDPFQSAMRTVPAAFMSSAHPDAAPASSYRPPIDKGKTKWNNTPTPVPAPAQQSPYAYRAYSESPIAGPSSSTYNAPSNKSKPLHGRSEASSSFPEIPSEIQRYPRGAMQ